MRNFISGSPKITDQEHAARQLARPLERLALYLEDPAARILAGEGTPRDEHLLALHPGSGSETKNWPLANFLAVAQTWIAPNESRRILLIGGEADEDRVARLSEALPPGRLEPAQNLPLTELAVALGRSGFSSDTIAGSLTSRRRSERRHFLLFGPTDPAIWAPENPQVRVLRSSSLTMAGISVDEVCYELMRIGIRT